MEQQKKQNIHKGLEKGLEQLEKASNNVTSGFSSVVKWIQGPLFMLILKVLFLIWLILQLAGCGFLAPAIGTASGAAGADMVSNALKRQPKQAGQSPSFSPSFVDNPTGAWDAVNYMQYHQTLRQMIKNKEKEEKPDKKKKPENTPITIHFNNTPNVTFNNVPQAIEQNLPEEIFSDSDVPELPKPDEEEAKTIVPLPTDPAEFQELWQKQVNPDK